MKIDGRLARCPLKGTKVDAIFAVLCACGHNIRKILARLRANLFLLFECLSRARRAIDDIADRSMAPQITASALFNVDQRELACTFAPSLTISTP